MARRYQYRGTDNRGMHHVQTGVPRLSTDDGWSQYMARRTMDETPEHRRARRIHLSQSKRGHVEPTLPTRARVDEALDRMTRRAR